MDEARAVQEIEIVNHDKLIEESKLTLKIKNMRHYCKPIVSAKVELLNIDAEW